MAYLSDAKFAQEEFEDPPYPRHLCILPLLHFRIGQYKKERSASSLLLEGLSPLLEKCMTGTYHAINGHFIGLGAWRSSSGKISSITGANAHTLFNVIPEYTGN